MIRLKQRIATIALLIVLTIVVGALLGTGIMWANAAEVDPTPAPAGWYILGNGASEQGLKNDSWTEFLPDFKLTSEDSKDGYSGTFTTSKLLLYPGDQLKFLYADGKVAYPNDTDWGDTIVGQYKNLLNGQDVELIEGGLGNIQVNNGHAGWFTFTLYVTPEGQIDIYVDYSDQDVPEIKQFEMYVVGHIASIPHLGWPGETEDADGNSLYFNLAPMKPYYVMENGEKVIKYYSEEIVFDTTDQIKVFNNVDKSYYPGGVADNVSPDNPGTFIVEWKAAAPSFVFVDAIPAGAEPVPTR